MAEENNASPEMQEAPAAPVEKPVAEAPAAETPAVSEDIAAPADAPAPKKPRARRPAAKKAAPKTEEAPKEEAVASVAADAPADEPAVPEPKKRGRPKKAAAPKAEEAPKDDGEVVVEAEAVEEYTIEEAEEIINRAVARKRSEVAALEKAVAKAKKPSTIAQKQALIDYLNADIRAYVSVIADMTDDDSLLEGIDPDADPVEVPEDYQKAYLDKLSADDLENEQEAEELRADYCDGIIEDMCTYIGESALKSKKMIRFLLDDPYALEAIGELVFYDDTLYDALKSIVEDGNEPAKKDKSKKGKKSGKKGKKSKKNRS